MWNSEDKIHKNCSEWYQVIVFIDYVLWICSDVVQNATLVCSDLSDSANADV